MTLDQTRLNPARNLGWFAGSADPGYFLEPRSHRSPTLVRPGNNPDWAGAVKGVLHCCIKHQGCHGFRVYKDNTPALFFGSQGTAEHSKTRPPAPWIFFKLNNYSVGAQGSVKTCIGLKIPSGRLQWWSESNKCDTGEASLASWSHYNIYFKKTKRGRIWEGGRSFEENWRGWEANW